MRTLKNFLLGVMVFTFLFTINARGQEKSEKDVTETFKPVFITITKTQRIMDPDTDFDEWLKIEKEYFDKVIMKNDLIIGSGVYFHYFTPDDSEVLLVSIYENWADIEKATQITGKLIDEAWPNLEEKSNFLKKQNNHYEDQHSDEIYVSLPYTKEVNSKSDKPLLYYLKRNELGDGGSGFKEYFENVTMKNSLIKGYYTHRHRWGSNSKDAIEMFVFDNFADIEKSFEENERLINEHWTDEKAREAFFKEYDKLFTRHGDFIYRNVPELHK